MRLAVAPTCRGNLYVRRAQLPENVPTRLRWTLLAVLVAALVLVSGAAVVVWFATPETPAMGITFTTEGSPVVGDDFRVIVTVRDPSLTSASSRLRFLYLESRTFDATSSEPNEDPWGLPNVWNLTGLDLSGGRSFVLETIPRWGAEHIMRAMVWAPRGSPSTVRFHEPGAVDISSTDLFLIGQLRIFISWPLELRVTAEGDFIVGGELLLTTTVRGTITSPRAPSLMYLSLELGPFDYGVLSPDDGSDPWGLPNVWNVTGQDLSGGTQFSLNVTPQSRGNRDLEARVWSPRNTWADVEFDQTRGLQNPESFFLWGSLTTNFPIT